MTLDVIAVALVAGLAGGAAGGVVIGAIQAWMARPKGTRAQYISHGRGTARSTGWPKTAGRPTGRPLARTSSGGGPFDRFSAGGKRVLALAQAEAIQHNHNYIGTEHLLGALLRDTDTVAAKALTSLGIDLAKVRTALEFIVGRGDQPTSGGEITLSPRTKKVFELAVEEAAHMSQHVGPEHLLLGLIDEGEGIASGILESLGAPLETVRSKVLELLKEAGTPPPEGYTPPTRRGPQAAGPFDRFSNRAKRALALAQDEAVRMGHNYIGPEHLLLGIARLTDVVQVDQAMKRIFDELGLTVEQLRAELAKVIPPVEHESPRWEVVLSPETKEVFALVLAEAADKAVLPEHLLVAIVRDEESFAAQIVSRLGVTAERVRAAVGH